MSATLSDLKQLFDVPAFSSRSEVLLAPAPDFSPCRPVRLEDGTWSGVKDHVKVGVRALLANPYFALFDEMGGMKSAQTIIAAQFLWQQDVIDRVIVIAPSSVRDVWFDQDVGELSLHGFDQLPMRVSEFHAKIRQWDTGNWSGQSRQLRWIITNYEFIRSKARLQQLKLYAGPRTLLVLDESSAIKSKTAIQSKACLELRRACGRVVLLNGTPIADTPLDLMNQANMLHPSILETSYLTQFRDRYCVMATHGKFPQIVGWKNLDDLQRRLAPYVLRRLKEHCLDLPPKLPPVVIDVKLKTSWPLYQSMKKDMIAWIGDNIASISPQAIVRDTRLTQITSGFLGGVEEVYEERQDTLPEFMQEEDWFLEGEHKAGDVIDLPGSFLDGVVLQQGGADALNAQADHVRAHTPAPRPLLKGVQEIGTEKLDVLLDFYAERLAQDPTFKLVVWTRFRPELDRLLTAFEARFPHVRTAALKGEQKKAERAFALRLLHPRTAVRDQPAFLAGIVGTGAMGHNFTAAHVVVYMSHDPSLFKHMQSRDRNHRPGQTKAVSYYYLVATGPDGQKTIDHTILVALKNKEDLATWTAKAWLDVLQAEA